MEFFISLITLVINSIFPSVSRQVTPLSENTSPTSIQITLTPTPPSTVSLGFVGDLGLGRHITSTARTKNDFSWSFQKINPWLLQNDANYANLESPIIKNCPQGLTGTFTFCGDDRFLPYLKENKFILTLANNHMFNYSSDGFNQTKKYLTDFNLNYVYSLDPETEFTTQTINGISFGFLGFDFITYPSYDKEKVLALIKKYNPLVDWLIVSLHWGNEYLPKAEKWRVDFAHQLVDAGADIIHGHHPHVWQGVEDYQGKKIYYSFGNFIFDQSWSYETSHSNIVRLTLDKTQIIQEEIFPIEIKFNSQPALML